MGEELTETEGLDADLMLRLAAQWLLQDPDRDTFLRHMAERGPALFQQALTDDPQAVARAPSRWVLRSEAPQFFRSLGWMILSSMPLPSHGWQAQKLALPGRNDACFCGSLRKFKRCCAPLLARAPRLDAVWLGALVVQALPAQEWLALPASRVSPDSVAAAADGWAEQGRQRDALKLLEPWGKAPAPWKQSRAELLDLLADLYLDLGHPRKRKALADAMVARGDAVVQSLGWQRLSMMASDAGRTGDARQAFERAQRLTPDEPRVALLEVTTLLGSGDLDRAHERAAFHARRLSRLPHAAELAPQIEGLQAIARGEMDHVAQLGKDPADGVEWDTVEDARHMQAALPNAGFDELAKWLQGLPLPKLRLDFSGASEKDLGELKPAAAVRPALKNWSKLFAGAQDGLGLQGSISWLPLLKKNPALLDCFDVLDDVLTALYHVPFGMAAGLQATLMQRAMDLWTQLRQRYPNALCEWGWLDNRPALRLLADWVQLDRSPLAERSFGELRALVEVMNPNDNQGLRDRLGAVLLRRGDTAAALALAERYRDDFVGMELLHVRALLGLQRLPEAATRFAAALKGNPHVLKLLQGSRAPRVPDVNSCRVGSKEQAQIVVANQHDLWRDKPLQAWLKLQGMASPGQGSVQLTLT